MTPAMLAAFVSSEHGRLYGRVCRQFGIDPAAGIEDDVTAYNLRVGLLVADTPQRTEPELTPGGGIHYDGGIRGG